MAKEKPLNTTAVPGSMERLPDGVNTFSAPIHQMLADKVIRRVSERIFEAISDDPIRIEDAQGRVQRILTKGTFFISITWDYNKAWHNCFIDWSHK